jgi:hypothetical protein
MKRIYSYRGFDVTVQLEAIWETSGNVTVLPPKGFVAVVHIVMAGTTRPMVAPIRLRVDGPLFASEAEALMAGFSAGQRAIDATFVG